MNWTGGRLQQASRGRGNTVLNRQKQYFAKARTKLQPGPHRASPFRPSFWTDEVPEDHHVISSRSQSVEHSYPSNSKRQKTMYDFECTAPVARRLNSMTPKAAKPRHSSEATLDDPVRVKGTPEMTRLQRLGEADPPDMFGRPVSNAEDDVPQFLQNRHRLTEHASRENPISRIPNQNHLEEARRKLLNQDDWTGLRVGKPLKIQFPTIEEKERIGKRRKLSTRSRHNANGPSAKRIISPFQEGPTRLGPYTSGPLRNKQSIKIRIGPDALLSQFSTQLSHGDQYREESLESMLLDAEVPPSHALQSAAHLPTAVLGGISTSDGHGRREDDGLSLPPSACLSAVEARDASSSQCTVGASPRASASRRYPAAKEHAVVASDQVLPGGTPHRKRLSDARSFSQAPQERTIALRKPVRLMFQSSSPTRPYVEVRMAYDEDIVTYNDEDAHVDSNCNQEEGESEDAEWKKFLSIPGEEDTATEAFRAAAALQIATAPESTRDLDLDSSNTYMNLAESIPRSGYTPNGVSDTGTYHSSGSHGAVPAAQATVPPENHHYRFSTPSSLQRLNALAARPVDPRTEMKIEGETREDANELWRSFVFDGSNLEDDDEQDTERQLVSATAFDYSLNTFDHSTKAVLGASSSSPVQCNPALKRKASSEERMIQPSSLKAQASSKDPDAESPTAAEVPANSLVISETSRASMSVHASSVESPATKTTYHDTKDTSLNKIQAFLQSSRSHQKPRTVASSMENNVSESSDELSSANPKFSIGRSMHEETDGPKARFIFSKPTPFQGSSNPNVQKVIRLGQSAKRQGKRLRSPSARRFSSSVYDLPESEEADSIEDD